MRIILASGSPRRKELLELMGLKFDIIVSDVEEKLEESLSIEEQIKRLAYIKANEVYKNTTGPRIVIGADTVVVKDNIIYGKPKSREHAKEMLLKINGNVHEVITGLCVLIEKENGDKEEYIYFDITKIYVKQMTENEIDNWLEEGRYKDKAAAYAIQSEFAVYIEKIEGNYFSVVGLPIQKLYDILKILKKA